MLKKKRIGLIIWGSLLSGFGIFFLLGTIFYRNLRLNDYSYFNVTSIRYLIFALMLLAGGTIMLVFGIRNAILTSKENKRLLEENLNLVYRTTCFACNSIIEAKFTDFMRHSRYPEGFVYCPICRRPLSIRAFRIESNSTEANEQTTNPNAAAFNSERSPHSIR